MIQILSLVNFNNQRRAEYLPISWGSYYKFNPRNRHIVMDSSAKFDAQSEHYNQFKVEVHHRPGMSYAERFRLGLEEVRTDYFLFFPDDFKWIFNFPVERAVEQARRHNVHSLKLVPRGQDWYSKPNSKPTSWYEGSKVNSGELLSEMDDLRISNRRLLRNFHEQFSLGCNIINTNFARWIARRIPFSAVSPGQAEKWAYFWLLFYGNYNVGYYKMWTPAVHFVDLEIEGNSPGNLMRAKTNLCAENIDIFNQLCNGQ